MRLISWLFSNGPAPETEHIRAGEQRIGDALHGIADNLEAVRVRQAEQFGLPAVKVLKSKGVK